MAAVPLIPKRPICPSCRYQFFFHDLALTQLLRPTYTQLRGIKKSAKKPTTINVKLLKDIKGYGRKGSIVPVAPGLFRNTWLPRRRADYISTLPVGKRSEVAAERDFNFGLEEKEEKEKEREEEGMINEPKGMKERVKSVAARMKLISPERATEILKSNLPSQIIFYRVPINDPQSQASPSEVAAQQRRDASPAAAALAAASAPPKAPALEAKTIFGSVTTVDMADSIKALLAREEETARVVVGAEDISIIGGVRGGGEDSGIEGDRLKALGDFQVEVRVKGGEPVLRTVTVRAQDNGQ